MPFDRALARLPRNSTERWVWCIMQVASFLNAHSCSMSARVPHTRYFFCASAVPILAKCKTRGHACMRSWRFDSLHCMANAPSHTHLVTLLPSQCTSYGVAPSLHPLIAAFNITNSHCARYPRSYVHYRYLTIIQQRLQSCIPAGGARVLVPDLRLHRVR